MLDKSKTLLVVLLVSIVANATLAVALAGVFTHTASLRDQVSGLAELNENLTRQVNSLEQQSNLTQNQLQYYMSQAEYYSLLLQRGGVSGGLVGNATVNIVAVREKSDLSYEGVTMLAQIRLTLGQGRPLISIGSVPGEPDKPLVGIDIQTSLLTGILVAENVTKLTLNSTDVILSILPENQQQQVQVVDGPSAGAAITIAVIAAMTNSTISTNVYVTGTINPDLSIGQVGGVVAKAEAAAGKGATVFIVPKGQTVDKVRRCQVREFFGVKLLECTDTLVNVQLYLQQLGFDTRVVEASNIQEAFTLMTNRTL